MRVRSLGWEETLEEGMVTHSNILSWRIHGQRILVGYNQELNMTEQLSMHIVSVLIMVLKNTNKKFSHLKEMQAMYLVVHFVWLEAYIYTDS